MELNEIRETIRQLPPSERQRLIDELLAEYGPGRRRQSKLIEEKVLETAANVIADRKDLLQRLARR